MNWPSFPCTIQLRLKPCGKRGLAVLGDGIKCLHTHLADFLADSKRLNPIGSLAAAILEDKGISVDFCFDYQLEGFCRGHDAANSS